MEKLIQEGIALWQFDSLRHVAGIRHFVSDRHSFRTDEDFTLSYSSTPDREAVRQNRARVALAMGVEASHLFMPSQVHKTHVVRVTPETTTVELMETDALVTNVTGVCIAVMSADCVPILLYDRRNRAAGAVHSGWRGTVAKILTVTLERMAAEFGTRGEDLLACIGPSVCQASYEVGSEVVDAVREAFGADSAQLMIPQPENKARLDLWQANRLQLEAFGVPADQIEVSDLCTVMRNDAFFSARKGDAGRFAAGIALV